MKSGKIKFILVGSSRSIAVWCRENRVNPNQCRLVTMERQAYGLRPAKGVIIRFLHDADSAAVQVLKVAGF